MTHSVREFYDDLAEHYHLIFDDWDKSIERQARILSSLLTINKVPPAADLLDCACGIGTQAIGLARAGYRVTGSDLSAAAVARAKVEAAKRGLNISFRVSDMTSLTEIAKDDFDVVAAMDNALPHLTREQTMEAARAFHSKLKPNGIFIAGIRDYDRIIVERPAAEGPAFMGDEGERRIVHQVWEWIDQDWCRIHLYITVQAGESWRSHHFVTKYRAMLRSELRGALEAVGFVDVRWVMPQESGSYLPIVVARKE
jgi:SAM-dependent methyltransferase